MSPIPIPEGIKIPNHDFLSAIYDFLGTTRFLSSPALSSQVCTFFFNKSLSRSCICLTPELFLAWTQEPSHGCSRLSPLLDMSGAPSEITNGFIGHMYLLDSFAPTS